VLAAWPFEPTTRNERAKRRRLAPRCIGPRDTTPFAPVLALLAIVGAPHSADADVALGVAPLPIPQFAAISQDLQG
jgi:hypothetical protein